MSRLAVMPPLGPTLAIDMASEGFGGMDSEWVVKRMCQALKLERLTELECLVDEDLDVTSIMVS